MNSKKFIFLFVGFTALLLLAIATFNYNVDPLCYYCQNIEPGKSTLNQYYQAAQVIIENPDAEQIILGSSRGQTTPPLWVQKVSGLKTINLSTAGSEVIAKKAFLNLAMEKTKLKKVIWYTDYFELINESASSEIQNTRALIKYTGGLLPSGGILNKLHELQKLIDHNSTEASFVALKRKSSPPPAQGSAGDMDYTACEKPDYPGLESADKLRGEVELIYDSYVHGAIKPPQTPKMWNAFASLIQELPKKKISVLIVIPPYNPTFARRLKAEYPSIYQAHLKWVQQIQSLAAPGIEVRSYFDGIPGDDESPSYWNDGVHFTCKAAMKMLHP